MKKNMNTKLPALKLAKETLRALTNSDLRGVAGGSNVSGGLEGCDGSGTIGIRPIHPVQKQ